MIKFLSRFCVLILFSTSSFAGSEVELLINMLHANGTVDDTQYQRLIAELNSNKTTTESPQKKAEPNKDTIRVSDKGIQLKSHDGEFTAKIGGRVQVDSTWYDEDGSEMGNGTEVRRARLYIQGKMFHDWGYKLQYDFTGTDRNGIKDAFLSYNGFQQVQIKAGNFKDPFMLQEQTSSKHIVFMERSLMDAFSAGRHIGIMASSHHRHGKISAGLFGDTVNSSTPGKDDGWGVAGRANWTPINQPANLIHLGAAINYRDTGDSNSIRFKQQAETHVSCVNIVDTGSIINADSYLKLGAEFAAVKNSFSFQSEYVRTLVERHNASNLAFDGWYAQTAYFITGESRRYHYGKFANISPNSVVGRGGIGAWQLATRYSTIDLNDQKISGGKAESVSVGVNWFPTSTLRLSANYVNILNINGGDQPNEKPSLLQLRGQWAF